MAQVLDQLAERRLCQICALALPRNAAESDTICSRRCAGLRKISAAVLGPEATEWRRKIVQELATLRAETTVCPGELAKRLLPELDKPLTVLRPLLYQMAEEKRVVLSQKNVKTPWWKIRGPFRIRLG
jgi:hypothetical protein